MATRAAAKPSSFVAPITWPSRLVPGAHAHPQPVPRKKPSAVTLGQQAGTWKDAFPDVAPTKQSAWQHLAQTLLPQPATQSQRARLAGQVTADFFSVILGFSVVAWLANGAVAAPGLWMLYGIVFTLMGYSERLYHPEVSGNVRQGRFILLKSTLWCTFLTGGAMLWSSPRPIAVAPAAVGILVSSLAMLAWRSQWHWASTRSFARSTRNVLVIGAGDLGRRLASQLEQNHFQERVVRGFLDENQPIGGEIRGRMRDLPRVARSEFVDEVIITSPHQTDIARQAIWEARRNHIDVKLVPDIFGIDPAPVMLERIGGLPVLTLCEEHIPSFGLSLKRGLDILLSTAGLLFLLPCLAVIAMVIKLDSPGPLLYAAPRLGRKGRRFPCYKFRTMVTNANELKEALRQRNERSGAFFKIADDPRVTRVGRILRRYSLDELPQLWNVFRGEMSLVGPRPHPVDDFERYSLEDLQRLEVPPA